MTYMDWRWNQYMVITGYSCSVYELCINEIFQETCQAIYIRYNLIYDFKKYSVGSIHFKVEK